MTAALERLQRDVHEQCEEQEDEPEREREPEVALARVQRDRGREGAGLAADVAAHGHGGSDLRDDVAEGGRDHRREGEPGLARSEEHTSELQSRLHLVCRLLLEKKKKTAKIIEFVSRP